MQYPSLEGLDVMDPETMKQVQRNGKIIGEVMMRGNIVMKGYLKDPVTNRKSFKDGWFHTGDLAVIHPDGYIELKDRSKDIIISGGENISSIEIESTIYEMDGIVACAVIAMPDEKWGESPCAFIEIEKNITINEEEVIDHCKKRLAKYKLPKKVIFKKLPKTSTGKIQKFILRDFFENN